MSSLSHFLHCFFKYLPTLRLEFQDTVVSCKMRPQNQLHELEGKKKKRWYFPQTTENPAVRGVWVRSQNKNVPKGF